MAKIRKRTKEEKKDSKFYSETFNLQRLKNMFILLFNRMNVVITKGESLESEYPSLIADLENEINNKE
ncbi:hypothetical protein [Flagellimonas beolgyonensis]|uniref:hypothetical protein n=1 Tax=Flagellimonas beolgyonensis TaxID=864064 RepID=UPI000F8E8FAE|nr:hypothetical protein [Allomuricauda beolgyonensis]